eukprot:2208688-Prymnesium_polylepis.1
MAEIWRLRSFRVGRRVDSCEASFSWQRLAFAAPLNDKVRRLRNDDDPQTPHFRRNKHRHDGNQDQSDSTHSTTCPVRVHCPPKPAAC